MYIQPPDRPIPPKNYSGNAFSREGDPLPLAVPTAPAEPMPDPTPAEPDTPSHTEAARQEPAPPAPEAAIPASAPVHGGLLSRIPFLSSLLPPPRGKAERRGGIDLPDWVLIGAVALLFLSEGDNDILPFLLLLLLWD